MSKTHELRCYEYVNRPYETVSRLLATDAAGLFQRATNVAADRAHALNAHLKLNVAGFDIGKDIRIEVVNVDTAGHPPAAMVLPATKITLRWRAASNDALFPTMEAELVVYPLSSGETQLDLHGWYKPPGALLGRAADTVLGHRVADAAVHRFLQEIVEELRVEA
jgi:hypothetical protein